MPKEISNEISGALYNKLKTFYDIKGDYGS